MTVDDPDVLREVEAEFRAYEHALVTNDVAALNCFFWSDPRAVRYGSGENLYGSAQIQAFRAARSPSGLERELAGAQIVTFGRDCAVTATLFRRESAPGRVGRQMQTWVRTPQGWRIVAAHVSLIDEPAS